MTEIRWEDPPPAEGRTSITRRLAPALRDHPGEWAICAVLGTAESARKTVHAIRTGARAGFQPGADFEARSATVDGEHRVYVRYVGEAR